MAGAIMLVAIIVGLVGAFSLTQPTLGVGLLAGGCLLGIVARIAQADSQHKQQMQALGPLLVAEEQPGLAGGS